MRNLIIEKSAVKHNASVVKARAGRAMIYANLSGNAWGVGLVELAKLLLEEGINHFAVDCAASAAALRKAGLVEEEILMLRSITDQRELERLMDLNVVCTVGSAEAGAALNTVAQRRATVAEAHILVDCGLGFGGFAAEESEKIVELYHKLTHVAVAGLYTQVQGAYAKESVTAGQLERFQQVVETLHNQGIETGVVHAAGSFALLHYDTSRLDAVRAGSALLGRCRRVKNDGLQTVGRGEAAVEEVRWLPKGHTLGNAKVVTLRRPTRVAILPVGWQHGFGVEPPVTGFWEAVVRFFRGRRRTVRIGDQRVRVLGSIGAAQTILDVTRARCSAGDPVLFDIDPLFARGFEREYR